MLFWICPECGRECSPAVRECPGCAGNAQNGTQAVQVAEQNSASGTVNGHAVQTLEPALETARIPLEIPAASEPRLTKAHEPSLDDTVEMVVRPLLESLESEHGRARREQEARETEEAEKARSAAEEAEKQRLAVEENARLEREAEAERLRLEVERLRLEVEENVRIEREAEDARQAEQERQRAEAERLRLEVEEKARIEREAREAEEAEKLRLEAEEKAHREREAEQERLRLEAEEKARLDREAREAEEARLRQEAEEAERLRLQAEEAELLRLQAEERARELREAEETRLRLEAEEKARLEREAEEAARRQREAEEAERLRVETEERERLRLEAEEKARLEREAEEARLRFEAEEKARIEQEAQEAERRRIEAEEAARLAAIAAEQAGVRAIEAGFEQQPAAPLLNPAASILKAPAPPSLQTIPTPRPDIRPSMPNGAKADTVAAGPQVQAQVTPCLPRELHNLHEMPKQSLQLGQSKRGFPTWTVSVILAMLVFLATGVALQYITANRDAKAAPMPVAQAASGTPPSSAPAAAAPGREINPAKFLEVAGMRVVPGANKRRELHYILVNHSSEDLAGMTVQIAIRSAEAASSSSPLFTVNATIPALGAYQSKEVRTLVDASVSAAAVADWQSLRAEIEAR